MPSSNVQKYCHRCGKSTRESVWSKNKRRKNPEFTMFSNAKARAKRKNIPFEITIKDVIIPKYCPMLGIELKIENKRKGNGPSLDRIIPKLGYTKENTIVISDRANRIKNDATIEELERILKFLKKHQQ